LPFHSLFAGSLVLSDGRIMKVSDKTKLKPSLNPRRDDALRTRIKVENQSELLINSDPLALTPCSVIGLGIPALQSPLIRPTS